MKTFVSGIKVVFAVMFLGACSSAESHPNDPWPDSGRGDGDGDASTAVAGCPTCTLLVSNQGGEGLTVDGNDVYFTRDSFENGAINKAPVGGGAPTVIAPGLDLPIDIVAHATGIYWVALGTNRTINNGNLSVLPRGGGAPTILVQQQWGPLRLALDDTFIFWTLGDGGAIMKMPIDGSLAAVTLTKDSRTPYGIAIDGANVYWTAAGRPTTAPGSSTMPAPSGFVMRVSKDGGEPITVASEQANPLSIAVDKEYVYWVNVGSHGNYHAAGAGSVMKAPVSGGPPVVVVANLNDPSDLAIDDQNIYYATIGSKEKYRCDATVEKVPLSGGTPTIIARQQCYVVRIALDATHVYFATAAAGFPFGSTPDRKDAGIIKAPK